MQACVHAGACGGQQGVSDPLELESQVVVSLMLELGTELGSPERAVCALSPRTFPPA